MTGQKEVTMFVSIVQVLKTRIAVMAHRAVLSRLLTSVEAQQMATNLELAFS
jgi:hypothetical protein